MDINQLLWREEGGWETGSGAMRCTRQDSINGADECCQERRGLFMATTKRRTNQEVLGGEQKYYYY